MTIIRTKAASVTQGASWLRSPVSFDGPLTSPPGQCECCDRRRMRNTAAMRKRRGRYLWTARLGGDQGGDAIEEATSSKVLNCRRVGHGTGRSTARGMLDRRDPDCDRPRLWRLVRSFR